MRTCEKSFLSVYMEYTRIHEAPELFHLACGLTCLALAVRGARYLEFEHYQVFPNLYTLLLARTAECRKGGAVGIAYGLMQEAELINPAVMFEKITDAGLWKQGEANVEIFGNSTIFIFADELSLFLSRHEAYSGLIPFLTRFYETRRGTFTKKTSDSGEATLVNPFIVTLLATNPTDFAALIPASASGTGFAPRMFLAYQDKAKGKITFPEAPPELRKKLITDLVTISTACDPQEPKPYTLDPRARSWYQDWYENKNKKPLDPELDGWYGRKHTNLLKLAMLLAISESDELFIEEQHLIAGLSIVNLVEENLVKAYGLLGETPYAVHRKRILEQLERKGEMSRAELQHLNSNKLKSSELSEILSGLESEGKVERRINEETKVMYYKLKGGTN